MGGDIKPQCTDSCDICDRVAVPNESMCSSRNRVAYHDELCKEFEDLVDWESEVPAVLHLCVLCMIEKVDLEGELGGCHCDWVQGIDSG